MWATIGSIVVKYWVEFLLGLIVAGGGFLIKRFLKLEKEERKRGQEQYYKNLMHDLNTENDKIIKNFQEEYQNVYQTLATIDQKSKEGDKILQDQISQLTKDLLEIKTGILSIQEKEFKTNCRKLLAEDHEITLEEWEEIDADHEAYNALGGNHRGDQLYALVKKKAEYILTD